VNNTGFHNYLVGAAVEHGFPFMLLYAALSGALTILVWKRSRTVSGRPAAYGVALLHSWVLYHIQGLTHNAGLTTGDLYGWMLVGLIVFYLAWSGRGSGSRGLAVPETHMPGSDTDSVSSFLLDSGAHPRALRAKVGAATSGVPLVGVPRS